MHSLQNSAAAKHRIKWLAWLLTLGSFVLVRIVIDLWRYTDWWYLNVAATAVLLFVAIAGGRAVRRLDAESRERYQDQSQSASLGLIIVLFLMFFMAPMIMVIWWYLFDRK